MDTYAATWRGVQPSSPGADAFTSAPRAISASATALKAGDHDDGEVEAVAEVVEEAEAVEEAVAEVAEEAWGSCPTACMTRWSALFHVVVRAFVQ